MRRLTAIALVLVGFTGLTQIVLGVLFWTGHSLPLIPLHMRLGYRLRLCDLALGAGRVRPSTT